MTRHSSPTTTVWRDRLCAACLAIVIAHAQGVAAETAEAVLTLEEAVRLALVEQPLLTAAADEAEASREAAVAAAQLPDPMLFAGVRDLPIDEGDAFSLSDDTDTQIVIGIEQAVPTPAKRRLRGLAQTRDAERVDLEQAWLRRSIRRDTALAFVDAWRDNQALALVRAQRDEATLEAEAFAIAHEAAEVTLADRLGAELARERLSDTLAAREQSLASARSGLSRWIGSAAARPLASALALAAPIGSLAELLAGLPQHPEIAALDGRIGVARVSEDLAAAERHPDWRVELGYGHRREYSDMAMVQLGVDLPLFPKNRQDRRVESQRLRTSAIQAERDDALRRLAADAGRAWTESERLDARLHHFDDVLLPKAKATIDAALAAWRSQRGDLPGVLTARRVALEIALERLDLEADLAARNIQIDYLADRGGAP